MMNMVAVPFLALAGAAVIWLLARVRRRQA